MIPNTKCSVCGKPMEASHPELKVTCMACALKSGEGYGINKYGKKVKEEVSTEEVRFF